MKTSRFAALSLLFSVGGAALAVYAADVAGNWNEHCSKCHGADGKGQTKMGKKLGLRDLTDPAVQAKFTDEQAFKSMKEGVKDDKGKTTMKPTEGLSEAEMRELVRHVRALKK